LNWTVPARAPFFLPAVVQSHGWAQLPPFRTDPTCTELGRIERLDSGTVVDLRVRDAGNGVHVQVDQPLSRSEQEEVTRKVSWMLQLDQDLSTFYGLTRDEPQLAKAESQARGRILRSPTLFEDVLKTILTTNTSWSGTIRMTEALVSSLGTPLPSPRDAGPRAFPTPQQLAACDEDFLRRVSKLGYRAPFVLELSRSVSSGALELEALSVADLPTAELRKRLLRIKGVGDYAVANLLMLLGRYDFVPIDSWALTKVSQEWHNGQQVSRADVDAAFERWGAWRGMAFWLWEWT